MGDTYFYPARLCRFQYSTCQFEMVYMDNPVFGVGGKELLPSFDIREIIEYGQPGHGKYAAAQ